MVCCHLFVTYAVNPGHYSYATIYGARHCKNRFYKYNYKFCRIFFVARQRWRAHVGTKTPTCAPVHHAGRPRDLRGMRRPR